MQNLQNDLIELLRERRPDFFDNNRIVTDRVAEAAYRYDASLLSILLENAGLRSQFFVTAGEAQVFKLADFETFLHNRTLLPQSYTAYRDRIGLRVTRGRYLRESNDVVLAWPYKDCVLEGGQDKEDQKLDEVFYNETLAPDEITRLLAPKAFTSFTRYDAEGSRMLSADATELTSENLIIKGNNLLALHSLLPRFRGKIKLIYIDPPYNTELDSFQYNDKFTHSSWLTFMRNRLEAAKMLLCREGSIFIQLDDNEAGYCKVLCDEVFGRKNFIANAIWEKSDSPRMDAVYFSGRHDNTLIYARDISQFELNRLKLDGEHPEHYNRTDSEGKLYYTKPLRAMGGQGDTRVARPTLYYAIEAPDGTEVYPRKQDGTDGAWRWNKAKTLAEAARIEWVNGRNGWTPYYRIYASENSTRPAETIWTHAEVGSNRTAKAEIKAVLPEVEAFATPKPERLIERILNIGTNEGDLVMDFFVGSGTTAAVAHKMNRRYIGVEQMDYINTITVPRMQKVIGGEQGGISVAQNWTGGGSFLYCELKEDNTSYIAKADAATDTSTLLSLYAEMKEHGFLRIEVENWDDNAFAELSLDEQKRVLLDCLDKNHLYVNLSEMEDADHKLSATDIQLNKTFYGLSASAE